MQSSDYGTVDLWGEITETTSVYNESSNVHCFECTNMQVEEEGDAMPSGDL